MTVEQIRQRITHLERLLDRDASYTIPSNLITGEQTLALYAIAEALAEIQKVVTTWWEDRSI